MSDEANDSSGCDTEFEKVFLHRSAMQGDPAQQSLVTRNSRTAHYVVADVRRFTFLADDW
jgi:hypothetical protein